MVTVAPDQRVGYAPPGNRASIPGDNVAATPAVPALHGTVLWDLRVAASAAEFLAEKPGAAVPDQPATEPAANTARMRDPGDARAPNRVDGGVAGVSPAGGRHERCRHRRRGGVSRTPRNRLKLPILKPIRVRVQQEYQIYIRFLYCDDEPNEYPPESACNRDHVG